MLIRKWILFDIVLKVDPEFGRFGIDGLIVNVFRQLSCLLWLL